MKYTLSLLETHRDRLRTLLFVDGAEAAALLLCGRAQSTDPWSGEAVEGFVSKEVVAVDASAYEVRSVDTFTWATTPLYQLLKRAEARGLAVGVVHSHPNGVLRFSAADDVADREQFEMVFNRLESTRPHFSAIMDADGQVVARAYEHNLSARPIDRIRIIGQRWDFNGSASFASDSPVTQRELDRQVRTFGKRTTDILQQLQVGVVGCGGTGSAVAALLSRMGVGFIALFDDDHVELTNLNRLHYSRKSDAIIGRPKVDVVANGIADTGLVQSVRAFHQSINHAMCIDALRSCDVVFGCTDDTLGRNLLNRFAYFYNTPVIDVGLSIDPSENGGYDAFDGRVTVLQPGNACMGCRGLITPERLQAEALLCTDPQMFELHRHAGYVAGGEEPSPVVVTFTTEVATMAVNELFQRLTGFRGVDGACAERVRRFSDVKDADTLPGAQRNPSCPLCGSASYVGRGDMRPFLNLT